MKASWYLPVTLGIVLVGVPTLSYAQRTGGTGGGSTGGTGAGGSTGGGATTPTLPNRTTTTPTQPSQRMPDLQRNIYLAGKVVLDDGTPPPEPVVLEAVCNGNPKPQGYTDSKGRFSFQLGQNSAVFADASTSGFGANPMGIETSNNSQSNGFGSTSLLGCELRAALPGFRSDTVPLFGKRSLENPDVGTIVLHRLAKVDGFTFSGTTSFAPKDARKSYEKGLEQFKKQKWSDAEASFQKAVDAYPKFAVAWYDLGRTLQRQNKLEEAKKAYAQSLVADAKFISPYPQLMMIAVFEGKWDNVAEYSDKAVRLNPYLSPDVYYYNSVASLKMNKLDAAEESARQALKLDEQHKNPKIYEILGVVLANKSNFPEAAENLKAYLAAAPDAKDADVVRGQLAEVEKLQSAKNNESSK